MSGVKIAAIIKVVQVCALCGTATANTNAHSAETDAERARDPHLPRVRPPYHLPPPPHHLTSLPPVGRKNGIQAALTAAVNEAIQARAPNPLDFIGDSLKAKAAAAAAAAGDEGNAEGNPGSGSVENPVSPDGEANTGPAESPASLDPPPAAEENADAPASTAASPEPDEFFKVCITPPTPLPHALPP